MAFYISRFNDMETKEFEVEVVTPMFLGGLIPKKSGIACSINKGCFTLLVAGDKCIFTIG